MLHTVTQDDIGSFDTRVASEEKSSVIENGASIRLIVEIVSTNWRDHYLTKLAEYEVLGIREDWIVGYAALGDRSW